MLKGKSAIITGGVRGIGKAIAEVFCKNGANVLLCYRSNDAAAEKTQDELAQYGTKVEILKGDVADPAFAAEAVSKAKSDFGKIDILVNNAGITKDKLLIQMKSEDFDSVVDTNLKGSYYFLREASSAMIKQKAGSIINLSSIVGVKGNPGQVNYAASKAGIIGMTMSAAKELGRRNVRVNAIAPGFIATEMTDALSDDQKAKMSGVISLGRMGEAEDVANVALFLASDMSQYVTAQTICVDGGMSI